MNIFPCSDTMERVVVSLTTSPERIHDMESVVDDIVLRQTRLPDVLYVNIPDRFSRTGQAYSIPDWLPKKPRVLINHCGEDYGPITKLFPTLEAETHPETMIIICDDDTEYGKDWIAELVKKANRFPDDAITYRCDGSFIQRLLLYPKRCKIPMGYGGVLFRRKHFQQDFEEYMRKANQCFNCKYGDDYVIGSYLDAKGVQIRISKNEEFHQHSYGFQTDALHRISNGEVRGKHRYEECHGYLAKEGMTRLPEPWAFDFVFRTLCVTAIGIAIGIAVVICKEAA